jgi:hypothetical protein
MCLPMLRSLAEIPAYVDLRLEAVIYACRPSQSDVTRHNRE